MRNQMRFEHPVDSDQPLDRVLPLFLVLNRVHESNERIVGRLRYLRLRAQLWEPLSERIGMQRVVIDLLRHLELDREFRRERDPSRHHPHHSLFGVPIILNIDDALADAVNAVESSPIVKCHRQ